MIDKIADQSSLEHDISCGNYKELLNANIFIIGGVASGKTELLQQITTDFEMPHVAIDVGKLFRLATYLILSDVDEPIVPDMQALLDNEQSEIERIYKGLLGKTRYLRKQMIEGVDIQRDDNGKLSLVYRGKRIDAELNTMEIDKLVSVIASSSVVRRIIWQWINKFAHNSGSLVITGHNLREIDTTIYKVVHLVVSDEVAASRLQKRQKQYNHNSARRSVATRNKKDGFPNTLNILKYVNGVITVNTDGMSIQDVSAQVIHQIAKRLGREKMIAEHLDSTAIKRASFKWVKNPVMQALRYHIDKLIDINTIPDTISRFDLLMQCLLVAPSFTLADIFPKISKDETISIKRMIFRRYFDRGLYNKLSTRAINIDLLQAIIESQIVRLQQYAENSIFYELHGDSSMLFDKIKDVHIKKEGAVYVDGDVCRHLKLPIGDVGDILTLKPVPSVISTEYARKLHYLHSERHDELFSFGAYLNEYEYPIAWVSYSRHDRPYKTELFHHMGLESHNIIEMTRAWNAPCAPKNTMSFLFSYAHRELKRIWDINVRNLIADKPLIGVSTTINPNLGFSGSAFKGANFNVFALRPANLQYIKLEYSSIPIPITRREASVLEESTRDAVFEAHIPQLPLNEMLVLFNKRLQQRLVASKVYRIDKKIYNEI